MGERYPPLSSRLCVLAKRRKLPSGVQGGVLAEILYTLNAKEAMVARIALIF